MKVAAAQLSAVLGDVPENLRRAGAALERAAAEGSSLVVLPECYLTGYVFDSAGGVRAVAIEIDGPEIREVVAVCARLGIHCAVGFLEKAEGGLFNAAVLIGPGGLIGRYRKAHLPFLGADRFVQPGNLPDLPVFETPLGTIGIAICYDLRFPEFLRALALRGADLVAMPTCWPSRSRMLADHFMPVRAAENRVFIVAADRGDSENGVTFLGRSQIVDPAGVVLAETGTGEALITATVDLQQARNKRIVFEPGTFELSLFEDRRPDLYGALSEPKPGDA
jgi:predicted amidohydrolase